MRMPSKKYQSTIESNNAFMVKIEDLVKEIVIQNSIPYYRIESVMEHHLQAGADDIYLPVIRIITYFEDTVSQISELLQEEFDVAIEKLTDKKKNNLDSFSYKHIQYIVGLKDNRRELTEYRRSGDKKFEIQVCSMLQDAWSGIERELGYDGGAFPEEAKRDLYRVGALLEMADIEFLKIRKQLGLKQAEIQTAGNMPKAVVSQPEMPPAKHEIPSVHVLAPEESSAANTINTFEEHLSAVAKDLPVPIMELPTPEVIVAKQPEPVVVAAPQPEPVVAKLEPIVAAPAPTVQRAPVSLFAPQRVMPKAPAPVPTPAPAAAFGLAPKRVKAPESAIVLDSMDMNVNSLGSLAMNVNNIENKNGVTDEALAGLMNVTPAPEAVNEDNTKEQEPVTPAASNGGGSESVALNIDNVHNFNMNVNGMIERTTEIIREAEKAPEKVIPFYEEQPKAAKPTIVDENAPMTEASLRDYVANSKLLKEVDMKIAERAGAKINPEIDIEGDIDRLRFLKVFTLKQLHDRITDNKNDIVSFAEKWIGKDNGGSFDSGICLFYLEYLLVGKRNDPAFAIEYVVKFISDNDYSARYIIPTYNSIRNTEVSNFSHLTLKA